MTLVPGKTKLLAFCPPGCELEVDYAKISSPIYINGTFIPFSESAKHVGVIRSVHGNLPNILARFAAHRRAVFSLLPSGLSKVHWGNPAACVRVERLYGISVMLSGLATMVLSNSEIAIIAGHFKKHMERLLKLHSDTPDTVVWFLAGCLPVQVLLHLRQISLFYHQSPTMSWPSTQGIFLPQLNHPQSLGSFHSRTSSFSMTFPIQ